MTVYQLNLVEPFTLQTLGKCATTFYDVVIPYAKEHGLAYQNYVYTIEIEHEEDRVTLSLMLPPGLTLTVLE